MERHGNNKMRVLTDDNENIHVIEASSALDELLLSVAEADRLAKDLADAVLTIRAEKVMREWRENNARAENIQ